MTRLNENITAEFRFLELNVRPNSKRNSDFEWRKLCQITNAWERRNLHKEMPF